MGSVALCYRKPKRSSDANFLYADFAEVGASAKGRKKCLTLPFFIDIINAPYATGGKGASIGEAIYKKVSDY